MLPRTAEEMLHPYADAPHEDELVAAFAKANGHCGHGRAPLPAETKANLVAHVITMVILISSHRFKFEVSSRALAAARVWPKH